MSKSLYLIAFLLVCCTCLQAQLRTLNGYLRDSSTHHPIANGTIINATSGRRVATDQNGFFRLRASAHDRLYAVAGSYRFDTLTYSPLFADTIAIYLAPTGSVLPGVTVTSQYNKYQLDSIGRRIAFEQARGPVMHTVASQPVSGFGLAINLDRFLKSKYRQQRLQEESFRKTEEAQYVFYRFSPEVVSGYTGLKGEELRAFMRRYTPSYTWLRQHPSDAEVMYYLNEKMKEFKRQEK